MPPIRRMHIRPAGIQDADVLIAFGAAMAWETEKRSLDLVRLREGTLAILADADKGFFIIAEHEEGNLRRPVGQLMITFEWSDWRNGRFWWVQSVYVDPAWRRRGVYRSMHDHIVAKAKTDSNVCGIRLYVEQNNEVAKCVYQRVGLGPSCYVVYEQDFVLASEPSASGVPTQRTMP